MGQDYEKILSRIAMVEKEYEDFLNCLNQHEQNLSNDFRGLSIQKALLFNLIWMCDQCDASNDGPLEFFSYFLENNKSAQESFSATTSSTESWNKFQRYRHNFGIMDGISTLVSFWLKMLVYSTLYTSKNVMGDIVEPYVQLLLSIFEGNLLDNQKTYVMELLESFSEFMKTFESLTLDEQKDIINSIIIENSDPKMTDQMNHKQVVVTYDTIVSVENDIKITVPKGYVYSLDKPTIGKHRSITILLDDQTGDFSDPFSATESITVFSPLSFTDRYGDLFNERDLTSPEIVDLIEKLKTGIHDAAFDPATLWLFIKSGKVTQANRIISIKRNRDIDISYFKKSNQDGQTIFIGLVFTKKRVYQIQFFYNGRSSLKDYKDKVISLLNSITV